MKLRGKILIALFAGTVAGAGPAWSDEWRPHHHHHGCAEGWCRQVQGGGISYIHGIGTYAGGVSAAYVPGAGLYMQIAPGVLPSPAAPPGPAPRAKVTSVAGTGRSGDCAMEHGVCVIRGGE